MNYFDIFELPVQLAVDQGALKRAYLKKSRQFHPDYFIHATTEEQATALQKSSELNQALQVLQDPDQRLKYVLQLAGMITDDEKYSLAPSFLMEVMDINESLMDLDMEPDESAALQIKKQTHELLEASYQGVSRYMEADQTSAYTPEALLQLKEYYFRKKYLQRILDKLEGIAPPL